MSSTYSTLKFELISSGEQAGIWGNTTNTNIGTAIEQAIAGMATLTVSDFVANVCTLTLANTNTAQDARALCLVVDSGALSAPGTLNVPAVQKPYVIVNNALFAITVKVSGQTGVTVPAGRRTVVYNDGVDVGEQVNFLTSLALGAPLPVSSGGTGGNTPAAARSALSAQETLVSGTNIRTVNGNSLLGSGDITINVSPAGTSGAVQFNSAGNFAASGNFTYSGIKLTVNGIDITAGVSGSTQNTGYGTSVLTNTTTGASYNSAFGYQALLSLTDGDANTAVGWNALTSTNTGTYNTAVGASALQFGTAQSFCTAVGWNALTSTNTGTYNTAVGASALQFGTAQNFCTAVGWQALQYATGQENTALGTQAGAATTSGTANTFVGAGAAYNHTTGSYNTFVGAVAGGSGALTGSNNVCVGWSATPATNSVSNTITLGNSSITTLRCQVTTITSLSDARDKTDLKLMGDALNLVRRIQPMHFTWNMRDGGKVGEKDTGFIAQQLLSAQEQTGLKIPGLVDETNPDKLEAGYGKLIPVLVRALQQLDAEFQAYKLSHP